MAKIAILGLGAMGSAAAYFCAARRHTVIGLEQFQPMHARGSSHGQSRIIRQAYFESPDYIPMIRRAYENWAAIERLVNTRVFTKTGGIYIGPEDCELVRGSLLSAQTYGLPHTVMTAAEANKRFPCFNVPREFVTLLEPNAGFLDPERSVNAFQFAAFMAGAKLNYRRAVKSFEPRRDGVLVYTNRGRLLVDKLIIAAGPWSGQVLRYIKLPLDVVRVVNAHFAPDRPERFAPGVCPIYCFMHNDVLHYGFPRIDKRGVKIGSHSKHESCTPQTIDRQVYPHEVDSLRTALNTMLPGAGGELLETLTCMYTNTPDGHFIIDRHPESDNIVYACGCSGHAFKFASVLGEILADLALDGTTKLPVQFLSASRFAERARRYTERLK